MEMKILWVNSSSDKTFSNTRLFGIPPVLERMGDQNLVLISGQSGANLPAYFVPLPMPFGKLKIYRFLVSFILPFLCVKYKPDVVLTDWMSARLARLVVLLKSAGLLNCKLVHDVRTVPVKEDRGKSWRVYSGSIEYAKRHFDGLTTITEPLRDEMCVQFNIAPETVSVWSSGVDVAHFHPQDGSNLRRNEGLENKFVVFYHGAVNVNRGVLELAQAAEFLRDLPDLRIVVVGGGNEWNRMETLVDEKKLDQVILVPGVPYAEIPRWIAMANLCVVPLPDHPWWRVSSPLKLMEYLAMGKPILLTEMPAHRVVIPSDDDAFYVPAATSEELAGGIRTALNRRDRFVEMGERGRKKAVADLTWDKQASLLRQYLQSVMEGKIGISNRIAA